MISLKGIYASKIFKKLLEELKSKTPRPIYFLQEESSYYTNIFLDIAKKTLIPSKALSFDYRSLYGAECNMSDLILRAKRYPMVSEYQLIVLREAHRMGDLSRESGRKLLINYCENPNPQTILCFAHNMKVLDCKKLLHKMLNRKNYLIDIPKINPFEINQWVQSIFQTKGYKIYREVANKLISIVGSDITLLKKEIDKITANLEDGDVVKEEDILLYAGQQSEFTSYEIQKALSFYDNKKVIEIVYHFIKQPSKYPVALQINILGNFFTVLLRLHHSNIFSLESISHTLNKPPYMVEQHYRALTKYSLQEVKQVLHLVHEAELNLKGIGNQINLDCEVLKTLILKILNISHHKKCSKVLA